jgi:hypothetical protein
MTATQRGIYGILFAVSSVLIALIISFAIPAMDASASRAQITIVDSDGESVVTTENLTSPMLSEDRYVPVSERNVITTVVELIEQVIPFSLPNTSGQCGEDSGISCGTTAE